SQVKQFSSHSSEDVFGSSSPSSLFFSSPLQALSSSSRQRSWSFSLLGIFESFRRRREGRSRRRKTRKQGRDPEDEGNSRQGAPSSSFPPLPPSSSFASPSVDKDKFRDSTRRGSASAYIRRRDDVNRENEEKVEEDEEDEYEGDMIEISFPLLPVSSSSGMSPETAGCLPEESEEEEELLEEKEKKGKEDGRSHQQKGETRKKRQKFLPSQAVTAERVSLLLRPVLLFFSLLYLFILPYTFLSFFSILLFFLFALLRLLPLCRNVSVKLLRSGWTEFSPETGPLSSVFVVACTPPPPSSSSLSSSSNPSQDVERERKKKRRPWHFEAKEEEEELPFLSRVKGLIEKGCLLFSSLSSCFSSLTSKVAPSLISNTNSNSSLSSSSSSSLSSSSSSSVSSSSVLWKRVERMVRVFLQIDFSSLFRFFFLKLERFLETLSLAFSGRSIEIELEYAVWKLSRNVEDPQGSTSLSCFLKFAPRQSNPLAAMCIQEEKETKTGKNRKKIDRFSSSSSLSAFRYLFPYLFTERKYGRRSLSPIEKKIKEEEEKEEETGAAAFSFSAVHTPENVTPLHLALHLLFGSRRKRNREILAFSAAGIFNHLDAIFDIALLSLQQEPDDLPSSTQ
ncbi:cral trio domain protein, partial [Cystoisospora suis]